MKPLLGILVLAGCVLGHAGLAQELTDEQIRQLLIERSIRSYSGSCACPYSQMRNGRRCGGNSAYSKPGGAKPLCYPSDVSNEMVRLYRSGRR